MSESLPPAAVSSTSLRATDCLALAALCAALFGFTSVYERVLATHETVHCLNVREMLASHDWLIPTYGGRPWLERPPLPHWITAIPAAAFGAGEQVWTYRLGSHVAGTLCVLLTAWMGAVWYGRAIGVFAGAVLATMVEFYSYSTLAESDISLCLVITCAMALFVRLEFRLRPEPAWESASFLGRRSWSLLAFFFCLGLTNAAKGLFFGSLFIVIPVAGFLLSNGRCQPLRRYIWFWGWLTALATGAAWGFVAWLRYPDIVDLWQTDYLGRLNQGYMKEPAWYYFGQLPAILFPWLLASLVGLGVTARVALTSGSSAARLLWCWAWLPVLFFSIPEGKHHHYLLHCLTPWAVLAALGACQLWRWLIEAPAWLRNPLVAQTAFGLGGAAVLYLGRHKIPGAAAHWPVFALALQILVLAGWWAVRQPRPRAACLGVVGVVSLCYCLAWVYRVTYVDRYRDDTAFIDRVRQIVPAEDTCYVKCDVHPLNGSWLLFYLGEHTRFLHNLSFLRDDAIRDTNIYLVGRRADEEELRRYGQPELVAVSAYTRGETSPRDRYALFRFHFDEHLARLPASTVRINPCQATGRAPGPFLE